MRENNKLVKNLEKIQKNSTVLFCFPFAGGGVSVYKEWIKCFQGFAVVCPIQLPGREERVMEKSYTQMDILLEDLIEQIIPFRGNRIILFGHSMGAKIAYEVGKKLENLDIKVDRLIISGSRAPHVPERNPIHQLTNEAFEEQLVRFEGLPKEILENKELLNFFLPMIRADFTMIETYCAKGIESLKCPIVALGGDDDKEANLEDIRLWEMYTKEGFKYRMFKGGHFFIREQEEEVLREVKEKLEELMVISKN